ncbi:MAG: DUF1820 family protein [Gammaproteobacteria bacterium]|nr:MAG: DUF1820 family protein [Gammaproteobacteria bacterium]
MAAKNIFKISFYNQGNVYEVYASKVYQSDLHGFITIEELKFDERTSVVVDPGEEKLKTEFDQVKRFFVPMHAIIRIDEVEKQGVAKISEVGENIAQFPSHIYNASTDKDKQS